MFILKKALWLLGERRKLIIYWYAKGFGIFLTSPALKSYRHGVSAGITNTYIIFAKNFHEKIWALNFSTTYKFSPLTPYHKWPAQFSFLRYVILKMENSRALNIFALFLWYFRKQNKWRFIYQWKAEHRKSLKWKVLSLLMLKFCAVSFSGRQSEPQKQNFAASWMYVME